MKVLAISGSLRRDSHNTALLRAAAELVPPPVELEIFDGLKAVEPYDEDDDHGPGPVGARRLREAIESADAVLSQAEVRKAAAASGARVIETELPVGHADEAFTDDGRLADTDLRGRYVEVLDELIALAEQVDLPTAVAA